MTEQELASAIWGIKEIIRDDYDDTEVENVILPFTVLRRLDCMLEEKYEKIKTELENTEEQFRDVKLGVLLKNEGLSFYNHSGLSLEKLLAEPSNIDSNFKTYLEGFTDNIKNILIHFVTKTKDDTVENDASADITDIYRELYSTGLLYAVVEKFVSLDLHPSKVSNAQMGTIFEIVIQRSKETTNAKAGQYFTPREIVRLLVALVMSGQENALNTHGKIFSIYDPCCGTGGMLTEAKRYIQETTEGQYVKISLYGQELNHKTYAIAKSDLLIKGDLTEDRQIRQGNTLVNDKIERSFSFMLANPPFGTDWSKNEAAIKKEAERKDGRYSVGLPSTNDGSLLFLLHMISKMDKNGSRIGIVLNGSPLFNGEADSGWSNIRKMLLDRNLLDCIVALPKSLFYGTDISTYLWILDNARPESRKDKVLFIDASDQKLFSTLLQRNIGKKRYEISKKGTSKILDIYKNYKPCSIDDEGGKVEIAKLFDYDDFKYTKVSVLRPLRLKFVDFADKLEKEYDSLPKTVQKDVKQLIGKKELNGTYSDAAFCKLVADVIGKAYCSKGFAKSLRKLAIVDPECEEVYEEPGNPESGKVADTNLNDTESIPFKQNIDEYFQREVIPFVPDAWMDRSQDKIGVEFPFTKLFYVYKPLRSSDEILAELAALDKEMEAELSELKEE